LRHCPSGGEFGFGDLPWVSYISSEFHSIHHSTNAINRSGLKSGAMLKLHQEISHAAKAEINDVIPAAK
jgi:hypothetical protein